MELPHDGPDVPPPPYSETDIYSHSHRSYNDRTGEQDDQNSIAPSSSTSNIIYTPPESPTLPNSAQAYFESRPANRVPHSSISVPLRIATDATPSDFPYPGWAREHETSEQDWATFVNYLMPEHTSRANSHIVERKVRVAEKEESSAAEHSITEAQPGQLKVSPSASISRRTLEAVVLEWNDGFFGPRGVTILPFLPGEAREQGQNDRASPIDSANADQGHSQPGQSANRWWNPFALNNDGTLHFGSFRINRDGIYSPSFEVDRNGVRWGGQNDANPVSGRGQHPHTYGPFGVPGHPGHLGGPPFDPSSGGERERGRGRGRGDRHGRGLRDHSCSSTSSSSSSSSSKSASSIGSLPDWDDLRDTQLDVAKQSVEAWLADPDKIVTREMVKDAKARIKAAKKVKPPPSGPGGDAYRANIRREVRGLLQKFKDLKNRQKALKKATREQLRQQKRAARRERRERKREEKRGRRERRREFHEQSRNWRRAEANRDGQTRNHNANPSQPLPGASIPMPAPPAIPVPPAAPGNAVPSPAQFEPPAPPPFPLPFGGPFRGPFGRGGHHFRGLGERGGPPFGRGRHGPGRPFHPFVDQNQHEQPFPTSFSPWTPHSRDQLRSTIRSTIQNSLRAAEMAQRDPEKLKRDKERIMEARKEAMRRTTEGLRRTHDGGHSSQAEALRVSAEAKRASIAMLQTQIDSTAARLNALVEGKMARLSLQPEPETSSNSNNNGDEKGRGKGKGAEDETSVVQGLETELAELMKARDHLWIEADEEYARFVEQVERERERENDYDHDHERGHQ
jgi:hypothetical protein